MEALRLERVLVALCPLVLDCAALLIDLFYTDLFSFYCVEVYFNNNRVEFEISNLGFWVWAGHLPACKTLVKLPNPFESRFFNCKIL